MSQIALSLNLRRLIKKIEDSEGDIAALAFAELPKDFDNAGLLQALLPVISGRVDLLKLGLESIKRKSFNHYSEPVQTILIAWAEETQKTLAKDDQLQLTKWVLSDLYRAELMHPGNSLLAPFTLALTDLMHADANAMLVWFQSDFYLFDIWVATISNEQMLGICPVLATQLHEENLIRLFDMLSELPNYDRPRGGPLPHKPWLGFIKILWQTNLPVLENVACSFIKGWRVDRDDSDVFDLMLETLAQAPSETKSHFKAGLFKFSTLFIQHLAKQSLHPTFDPVTSYQIVNRAEPDTTFEAAKWALQCADTGKLCDLVNAVTEDVVKGTSSVLRRFPAFFLLVGSLCKSWEDTHDQRKADFAKVVHTLGRHWSLYRPQFEREAAAEGQTHYFTSNAELVESSLGKVLSRTLT